MKTLLAISFVIALPGLRLLGEEPAAQPGQQITFFQRMFGPNAAAQPAALNNPPAQPKNVSLIGWPLFPAGQLPAGQAVNDLAAARLPVGNYANQTLYLVGDFRVTASADRRAVLRSMHDNLRIIAEYTPWNPAPADKAPLTLDESRGLLIRRIERNADGFLTFFVRDIVQP
ncbi:MAG: hypothetical protein ABJF10_29075 [Chthoniobacter sp.]|uniref:hypothetical protein n=1 Tax=Chthoniobacter sp. TaxID=2510640 RepID=UPI0032A40D87